ncbi:MAG: right-handed parallel beta-helix repeat-containing protein, partial [Candidatus Thermoplasmatota archaeon]|nr:right-handed parallel beta-helix repeat-containing protein [Candidatus Thermoplasmatota archaeon]
PTAATPLQIFDGNILKNSTVALEVVNFSAISITNNVISNNDIGIYLTNSSPSIKYNIIRDNRIGIYCEESSNPLVRYNNIYSNTDFGIKNDDPTVTIDARYNWWGIIMPTQSATPLASISLYCTYLPFLDIPFNIDVS